MCSRVRDVHVFEATGENVQTGVFTHKPQLDYYSERQPHNAYSLWKCDLNLVREAAL